MNMVILCNFPCTIDSPKKKVGSRTWHHPTAPASFPFAGTTFAQVPAGDGVGQDLQMALQGQLGEVACHDVQHLDIRTAGPREETPRQKSPAQGGVFHEKMLGKY